MVNTYDDSIIILASKSPRRRYLLQQAGLSFRVIPSSIDETSVAISSPETYVRLLSEAKANDVAVQYPDKWVIGADTIVLQEVIKRLSGQTHRVLTGYTICCKAKSRSFSETIKTDVLFKNLTDEEIEWYIQTKEPRHLLGKKHQWFLHKCGWTSGLRSHRIPAKGGCHRTQY